MINRYLEKIGQLEMQKSAGFINSAKGIGSSLYRGVKAVGKDFGNSVLDAANRPRLNLYRNITGANEAGLMNADISNKGIIKAFREKNPRATHQSTKALHNDIRKATQQTTDARVKLTGYAAAGTIGVSKALDFKNQNSQNVNYPGNYNYGY